MIIDEDAWRQAGVPEHDHVLVTAPDDGHIWECAFCSFGLSRDEMPDAPDADFWSDWEAMTGRTRADHRRNPIAPNRRSKQAAYEQAIADRNGKVRARRGPGVFDEESDVTR